MTFQGRRLRYLFLGLAIVMSVYLSLSKLGGLLVFGFDDLLSFCLFALPCLALPTALLTFWKSMLGAATFTLLTLAYLATEIHMVGFSPKEIAANNSWISLYIFTAILLWVVAALDVRQRTKPDRRAAQN